MRYSLLLLALIGRKISLLLQRCQGAQEPRVKWSSAHQQPRPQHSSTGRRKVWICRHPACVGQPLPVEYTDCFPATYRTHFLKLFCQFLCALYPQKTEMIQPAYSKGKCLNFSSCEQLSCKGRQLSISSFWLKQLLTSLFLAESFGLNHDWNTSCALRACFVWTATLLGRGCKETLVLGWPEPSQCVFWEVSREE